MKDDSYREYYDLYWETVRELERTRSAKATVESQLKQATKERDALLRVLAEKA